MDDNARDKRYPAGPANQTNAILITQIPQITATRLGGGVEGLVLFILLIGNNTIKDAQKDSSKSQSCYRDT